MKHPPMWHLFIYQYLRCLDPRIFYAGAAALQLHLHNIMTLLLVHLIYSTDYIVLGRSPSNVACNSFSRLRGGFFFGSDLKVKRV